MSKLPRDSKPGKKPARPTARERFVSFESDIRIIKKGGRIFVAEVTTKISELKRTKDNVIAFPTTRTKATISGEVDKTDY